MTLWRRGRMELGCLYTAFRWPQPTHRSELSFFLLLESEAKVKTNTSNNKKAISLPRICWSILDCSNKAAFKYVLIHPSFVFSSTLCGFRSLKWQWSLYSVENRFLLLCALYDFLGWRVSCKRRLWLRAQITQAPGGPETNPGWSAERPMAVYLGISY